MEVQITLTGTSPLIIQSPKLMDPSEELSKQKAKLTGKRAKDRTDEDTLAISQTEFFGSLYYSKELGPYVPGANVLACLRDGAKRARKGKKLLTALLIQKTEIPLQYQGPRDIDKLWGDRRFRLMKPVRNAGGTGVIRCRPIFHRWSLEVTADLDTKEMDLEELQDVAAAAGHFAGLGAWRPSSPKGGQYGRFDAVVRKGLNGH